METIIVLDAMGVLYRSCDDVKELLIPFIQDHNPAIDDDNIKKQYLEASLGNISSDEFWVRMGLSPDIQSEYLSRHRISDGLIEFLASFSGKFKIACLSNDVGDWSRHLRIKYSLDEFIHNWFISSDIGIRKPNEGIYRHLENELGKDKAYIFIDDNPNNVKKAIELGWKSYLCVINAPVVLKQNDDNVISSFKELGRIINETAMSNYR